MHPSLALLLTAVMVLANAFFVAAEFAFVKMRPTRLQQLAKDGRRRARLLLTITQQLPAYLSASQLGITVASLSPTRPQSITTKSAPPRSTESRRAIERDENMLAALVGHLGVASR